MKKKLLFIRFWEKSAISGGGEQLTNTHLEYICDILGESNVTVFAINSKTNLSFFKKATCFFNFFKNYHRGLTSKKIKQILHIAQEHDYVFIDRSVFGIIARKLKEVNYKGKIITFFHNFEQQYYLERFFYLNPLNTLLLKSVKFNETCACQYSDNIIALNQRDQNLIKHHYHRKSDFLIPISFKDCYTPSAEAMNKPPESPLNFLFVGSYFNANAEGILWFIKEVFPHITIRLQIVGKGMGKLKAKIFHHPHIEIYDTVRDLTPFYEEADCMIMPIFKGGGMKVKTCEALMYGKNIIGTSEAFEGYNIAFDKVGALANTKEEFIEVIKRFSAETCQKYNAYSKDFFLENHSENAVKKIFKEIIRN